jgi:hypothetical protein
VGTAFLQAKNERMSRMKQDNRRLTRSALLLAIALLLQALRLIIPIPPMLSTFLIGSLVNTCLLVSAQAVGLSPACMLGVAMPVAAYFQQMLPLPVLILPVAAGNIIFICLFLLLAKKTVWAAVGTAAIGKTVFLYGAFTWLLTLVAIPAKIAAGILFVMSWPQFITGIAGGSVALLIMRRLQKGY